MAWTGPMLEGYRVVELAIWVAGPAAGGLLADWGADVIKVEGPSGDPMREAFKAIGVDRERVPPYELDNRGKRCVELDLTTEAGREDMDALLRTADVFITNLRMPALEKLGLSIDVVRERFPRLIYAAVTGYGLEGPDRDRAGYDIGAFWARSSLAHTHAVGDDLPIGLRSAVGDHATAIAVVSGILAALLNRHKTGEGRVVDVSLLRTGIYLNGWDIGTRQYFGRLSRNRSRTEQQTPMLNSYRAGDGRAFWLLGVEQNRHWPPTLASIDRLDLMQDERFRTSGLRAKNTSALIEILDSEFAKRPMHEWTAIFDTNDVWWAPINTIPDVLQDPQAIAAKAFVDMPVVEGEPPYQLVNGPVSFSGYTPVMKPVHARGDDTEEVLREARDTSGTR